MAYQTAVAAGFSMTREQAISTFLKQAGWRNAERLPIPGDASFRRYERLKRGSESAILMDAPPEKENTHHFTEAQRYLLAAGLCAPKLLHGEPKQGLLLLEDFGDVSVSRHLRFSPGDEMAIYRDAVDVLVKVAGQGLSLVSGYHFPSYDAALLGNEVDLLPQWFLPEIGGGKATEAAAAYRTIWRELLDAVKLTPEVIIHRDYHADNLFLIEGEGAGRIGLLDFQDAVQGRAAYDLVSLLTDARRDVSPEIIETALAHFIAVSGRDDAEFRAEYAFYSAQRNAKILGIFARLFRRDGKPRYLGMIPRVWAHFEASLQHPSLAPLKAWQENYITTEMIASLPGLQQRLGS